MKLKYPGKIRSPGYTYFEAMLSHMNARIFWVPALLIFFACKQADKPASKDVDDKSVLNNAAKGTFGYDAAFLKQHTGKVLELTDALGRSKVLVSADYQGRVMSSTAN